MGKTAASEREALTEQIDRIKARYVLNGRAVRRTVESWHSVFQTVGREVHSLPLDVGVTVEVNPGWQTTLMERIDEHDILVSEAKALYPLDFHYHRDLTETLEVLEGQMMVYRINGGHRTNILNAGDQLTINPGVQHYCFPLVDTVLRVTFRPPLTI